MTAATSTTHMRRAFLALVVLGLAAVAALGWSGTATAMGTAKTSTTLAVSSTSIGLDDQFTMTATVAAAPVPQGTIRFWGDDGLLAEQPLAPVPGSSTQATASVTMA